MKVYSVKYKQFIPSDLGTVWQFFSVPLNLSQITPTEMKFKVLHKTGGDQMYSGQLISYRVSPFPLLRLRWTTEIKAVTYQEYFIDDQKFGPFALWNHHHFFYKKENGVEMIDEVSYALPLGLLGRLANTLFVAKRVAAIFRFRKKAIENIFKQPEFTAG